MIHFYHSFILLEKINTIMKKIISTISLSILGFPLFLYAQNSAGTSAESLVKSISTVFNKRIIPLLFTLGFVYVIWGIIQYIGADAQSKEKEEKKQRIFWGLVGLLVIISVWSLVAIVANTFGIFAGGSLHGVIK